MSTDQDCAGENILSTLALPNIASHSKHFQVYNLIYIKYIWKALYIIVNLHFMVIAKTK